MRDFWGMLSTTAKVGVVGASLGYLFGMGAIIVAAPVDGLIIFGITGLLLVFCIWFFFGREFARSRIVREGEAAEATILGVRSTGKTINEVYPEIELTLEVRPPDHEPYRVKTRALIDQVDFSSFQVGSVISVMVDPKNRKKVAVGRG